MTVGIKKERLVREFSRALEERRGALFLGAGMSRAEGYVNWQELIEPAAREIGLEITPGMNLITLAQYHVNAEGGRDFINRLILDELAPQSRHRRRRKPRAPNKNHDLIAQLPIANIWTSNYDHLIEEALQRAGRTADVKRRDIDLALARPDCDAIVHKMHGDIDHPEEAVLIKDDYERYAVTHPNFVKRLHADLLSQTFLFLGFSFDDPNLNYFLANLRRTTESRSPRHYWVTRAPQKKDFAAKGKAPDAHASAAAAFKQAQREFELRVEDLKRYGIQTLAIAEYDEITDLLTTLRLRSRGRYVFVSGSAHDADVKIDDLAGRIGQQLIEHGYHLLSAQGKQVGDLVIAHALSELYRDPSEQVHDRLTIRPFPRSLGSGVSKAQVETDWRVGLLARAGFAIFVRGSKQGGRRRPIIADGVMEEYKIARDLNVYPIPIGATGFAAAQIWKEVKKDFTNIFPPRLHDKLRLPFANLQNPRTPVETLVQELFTVLRTLSEP